MGSNNPPRRPRVQNNANPVPVATASTDYSLALDEYVNALADYIASQEAQLRAIEEHLCNVAEEMQEEAAAREQRLNEGLDRTEARLEDMCETLLEELMARAEELERMLS